MIRWFQCDAPIRVKFMILGYAYAALSAVGLVSTYAANAPFAQVFPLALDIITARWTGAEEVAA